MKSSDSRDSNSPHLLHFKGRGYLSKDPLGTNLPSFKLATKSVSERFFDAWVELTILILSCAMLLVLTLFIFERYDVR